MTMALSPKQSRDAADADAIDEAMIERVVRRFYEAARRDDLLGPVFAARVADWEPHLLRMCAFWSAILRGTRAYQGRPMQMHVALPIDARHFDRWLDLFEASAAEICPPHAAAQFAAHARRIGQSLELGIAASRGLILRTGGPSLPRRA
jgi:hemoglobin